MLPPEDDDPPLALPSGAPGGRSRSEPAVIASNERPHPLVAPVSHT